MSESFKLFPPQRKTILPGGYMGKILRVDLTTGSFKNEILPEEPLLRKLIGGQALATYILLHELSLNAKPFSPENKVVMMTGPITGTGFTPGGTKVTAVYLSPLTGHTLGRGAASGFWPVALRGIMFGWDKRNYEETIGIIMKHWKIKERKMAEEMFRHVTRVLTKDVSVKPDSVQVLIDLARENAKVSRPVSLAEVVNFSFTDRARKDLMATK